MSRLFHYMPLIFRSDRAEDMKATYLFNMEGPAGGQWSIQIAQGRADSSDGAPESHDTEVKTKPETWIDLSNGDINPAFAIMTRKVHLGGNAGLAMKLSTLFSVEE
jgi:putative sterol carrier protein